MGLESYILDKADALGLSPAVSVTVDPEGLPTGVCIEGSYTQEQQTALQTVITNDLGISKEDQQWKNRMQPST